MQIKKNMLKSVAYNCHFGCGLKSVAYIQDGLLINKLSFGVCI